MGGDFSRPEAQASKQAELAARDLMRLSRPGSKGVAGAANLPEGSSSGWPFLSHLSAMLLNRLQMTITKHPCLLPGVLLLQQKTFTGSMLSYL